MDGPCGRIDAHIARLLDEAPRLAFQLGFQRLGAKRRARQPRAAGRHAVEGEMHALLAERPNDVVLVRVEREWLPAHRKLAQQEELYFFESFERLRHAALEHVVHGERVIGVQVIRDDMIPGRKALRGAARPHRVNPGDEAIEIGTITPERCVVDPSGVVDEALEHALPGAQRLLGKLDVGRGHELGTSHSPEQRNSS
jgi:hypothetical protein